MDRLVETSRGWVVLDVGWMPFGGGMSVTVDTFGDDGWAVLGGRWSSDDRHETRSLDAFLADTLRIPGEEAARLADETVRSWRERGGDHERRRLVLTVLGGAGLLILLGILAVIALVVAAVIWVF